MESEVHRVCADLRFSQGLRRRWEEARAETALHEASSLAALTGARVPVERLRVAVATADFEAVASQTDLGVALGYWRAAWSLAESLPPLNRTETRGTQTSIPWRRQLATWHKEIGSFWLRAGLAQPSEIGIPLHPWAIGPLIEVLDRPGSIAQAAAAWRALATAGAFAFANDALGALAAKRILATAGIEPTAVAVLTETASQNPASYQELVRGGDESAWLRFLEESIRAGAAAGQTISRTVLSR